MGEIRKRRRRYYIRWYRDGVRYEESAHSTKRQAAVELLKLREGKVAEGVPITAKLGQVTFDDAAKDAIADMRVRGKKSIRMFQARIDLHLRPYFGGRRLASLSAGDIQAYIVKRKADTIVIRKAHHEHTPEGWMDVPEVRKPVSNAQINRELQTLRRILNLAIENEKLIRRPKIRLLSESAPRAGFFEPDQIAAVIRRLPMALRGPVFFAYVTGWRMNSEVLALEWHQVDFDNNEIRIAAGVTKGGEARIFPMTPELRALLEAKKAEREKREKLGVRTPRVFVRGPKAKPIVSLIKAFRRACERAGFPGRIPHDLRRSAARQLIRASVSEPVAMALLGHRTPSIFRRYNITSGDDRRDAAERLSQRLMGAQWGHVADPEDIGGRKPRKKSKELEAPPRLELGNRGFADGQDKPENARDRLISEIPSVGRIARRAV